MNIRTVAFEDGSDGLAVDHADGSCTVTVERPDGSGFTAHLDAQQVRRFRDGDRYRRAGRASADAKKARGLARASDSPYVDARTSHEV